MAVLSAPDEEVVDTSHTTVEHFLGRLETDFSVHGCRLEKVAELVELYRARGLLPDDRDYGLFRCCPKSGTCWANREEQHPLQPDRAGIAVPWIGQNYLERRIVVLGENLNDFGGLDAHWDLCRGYAENLRAGLPAKGSRVFGERAGLYAWAVAQSLDGKTDESGPRPGRPAVGDAWDGVAFLESVKCSPSQPRSEPFPEMWSECVDLLLIDELRVLRPRTVLLLGRSRLRDAVRPLLRELMELEWKDAPGSLERDTFLVAGQRAELFCLNHPSSVLGWGKSFEELRRSLSSEPIS